MENFITKVPSDRMLSRNDLQRVRDYIDGLIDFIDSDKPHEFTYYQWQLKKDKIIAEIKEVNQWLKLKCKAYDIR